MNHATSLHINAQLSSFGLRIIHSLIIISLAIPNLAGVTSRGDSRVEGKASSLQLSESPLLAKSDLLQSVSQQRNTSLGQTMSPLIENINQSGTTHQSQSSIIASPIARPEPLKSTQTMEWTATENWLRCVNYGNGLQYDQGIPCNEEGLFISKTGGGNGIDPSLTSKPLLRIKYICAHPDPGTHICPDNLPIYYSVRVNYKWWDGPVWPAEIQIKVHMQPGDFDYKTYIKSCIPGDAGICSFNINDVFYPDFDPQHPYYYEQLPDPDRPWHMQIAVQLWITGSQTHVYSDWDISVGLKPVILPEQGTLSNRCSGDGHECSLADYQETQGNVGHPINTRTGGFDESFTDLSIPTYAGPLSFVRTYSSLATGIYTNTLGYGWTYNHDVRLIFPGNPGGQEGIVWLKAQSANQYRFDINPDGSYMAYPGVLATLTHDPGSGQYTLIDSAQNIYAFNQDGKLITLTDPLGHALTYTYNPSNKLSRVTSPDDYRYLAFSYDNQDRLISVSDSDLITRTVSFSYDAVTGDLASATDVLGRTWTYNYDITQNHPPHLLTEVVDPRPGSIKVFRNEYDGQGRAIRQYNGEGENAVEMKYNYIFSNTTVITDGVGITSTHQYDSRYALARITDYMQGHNTKTYDGNFRPFTIADPFTHTTHLAWSLDGNNLLQVVDAASYTTTMTYDGLNNLTSVTDPLINTTSYVYSGTLLTSSTDALYNTTLYTYTTSADALQPPGLLKAVRDPNRNLTTYTYNQYGQPIQMTDPLLRNTTYTYNTLGLLQTITYPSTPTRVDWTCYDNAGRVVRTVVNAKGTGNPCDPVNYIPSTELDADRITTTIYDAVGNIIATIDPGGRITRTYYDDANRPIYVVRNLTNWDIYTEDPPLSMLGVDENVTTQTKYDSNSNPIGSIEWLFVDSNVITRTTRTYFDDLSRPEYVLHNWVGDWNNPNPPPYNPPDENFRTQTAYDIAGNVIQTIDNADNVTYLCYDNLNRVVKTISNPSVSDPCVEYTPVTDQDRDVINLAFYDANGNVIATIDPLGRITRTYYDNVNRSVLVIRNLTNWDKLNPFPPDVSTFGNEQNVAVGTQYDSAGNAIAHVEWLVVAGQVISHITRTYYDSLNRPVTVVRNLTGWTVSNPIPPVHDPNFPDQNVRTDTIYDQDSSDAIATIEWLANDTGQLISYTTRTYFDALSRPIAIVKNLSGWNKFTDTWPPYDPGYPDKNMRTEMRYDGAGMQIATIEVLAEDKKVVTRLYYDGIYRSNHVVRNLSGQNIEYPWPPDYNPILSDQNVRTDTIYDVGNAIASVDWLALDGVAITHTTRTYYDGLNRPVAVVRNLTGHVYHTQWPSYNPSYPDKNVRTEKQYDTAGNLSTSVDVLTETNMVTTRYEYDRLNRLTGVIDNYVWGERPNEDTNVHTVYGYDRVGNRLSVTDGNAHSTTFTYDALNRLKIESDALQHRTTYNYDATGNRINLTDANEYTTYFSYDGLGRLVGIDYPTPDTKVQFSYNALGWRTRMGDGVGTTTWSYDGLGHSSGVTDPFNGTVSYAYDALGSRTAMTYPDQKHVSYTYDPLGRMVTASDWDSKVISYTYNALGSLLLERLPDGVTAAYTYDGLNRQTGMTHSTKYNTLSSFQYTYDAAGNRTSASETLRQVGAFDLIFADGFESGNFSAWSSHTPNTKLSVSHDAALVGYYGMKVVINDNSSLYVTDSTPNAEKRYRARFYFDPNTIAMGSSDVHDIFMGYKDEGQLSSPDLRIQFRRASSGGNYQVQAGLSSERVSWVYTPWVTISDSPHYVELDWKASTAEGANNGYLTFWTDGTQRANLTGIDNDTYRIDSIRLGAVSGIDTGTRGTYYFDAFQSRKETYIGPETGGGLLGSPEYGVGTTPEATLFPTMTATNTITMTFPITATLPLTVTPEAIPEPEASVIPTPTATLTATVYLTTTLPLTSTVSVIPELPEGGAAAGALSAGPLTITYTYDKLYRLRAADYSNGAYFHYTYDAVGNRLTQTVCSGPDCRPVYTTYLYDIANRLTSVNGVQLQWDNNGNLTLDHQGVHYSYDHANHLIGVMYMGSPNSFAYNGLGDRLKESWGLHNTINLTLDLNGGLTQVLSDGNNTYLYGLGRIAQQSASGKEYFLDDALGSVRQLAGTSATTLNKSYVPYGEPLSSTGQGSSNYGFAGEWSDSLTMGKIYLRARYYDPGVGRFISRDAWGGDESQPMSYNAWLYVYDNPINLTDPSGKQVPTPPPPTPPTPIPPTQTPTPYLPFPIPLPVTTPIACKPFLIPRPPSQGYMEGYSWSIGFMEGGIAGWEIVYDFATMARLKFIYTGQIGFVVGSIDWSLYAGQLWGFKWARPTNAYDQLVNDYQGSFKGAYAGISGSPIEKYIPILGRYISIGGGIGYFESSPSKQVKGIFTYLAGSLGLLPVEIVGFETVYTKAESGNKIYTNSLGRVNLGALIGDILSGNSAPTSWWGILWPTQNQRILAGIFAINEAHKYQAYYQWSLSNH